MSAQETAAGSAGSTLRADRCKCTVKCRFYMSILPAQRKAAEQLHALTRYQLSVRSPADEHPDPEPAPVQTAMAAPQLDEILATEINGRDIALFKPAGGTPFIRILKNPLFASASDKIAPNAIDLIKRIAEAVALTGADVTVVGYTDGQPIRSRRFPSIRFCRRLARRPLPDYCSLRCQTLSSGLSARVPLTRLPTMQRRRDAP